MEDNRFLKVYQEYKREKQESRNYETTNRFDCLREPPPIREKNRFDCLREPPIIREENRFDCLRNTVSISNQDSRVVDKNNRFSCLIDNDYISNNQPKIQERTVTYLPRPEPRASINETMKKYKEEKRANLPPPKPVFSFESEYHFPELTTNNIPTKEIKLPEPVAKKEMIVNTEILQINRKIITCMSFQNGKVITKEVYEDGTDVIPGNDIIIKKPQYSTWASVLKKNTDENQ
jgi:hypothetical protein